MSRWPCIGAALLLVLAASTVASAATIYRWVDERGGVHYAEIVPERYQRVARQVDIMAKDPSAEDRREALERAQKDKAKAAAIAAPRALPGSAAAGSSATGPPAARQPEQVPDEQTDCETWQRLYLESVACFGPYRTVRGATKPEAFDRCTVVPEPPRARCRMRIP